MRTFGGSLDRNAARDIEAQFAEYQARYGNVQPPTPYEDPTLYVTLLEMADSIEAFWKSRDASTLPRVVLGTLPTATIEQGGGIINAQITPFPTNEYIIVFQRGLFDFALEMSKLAASVFRPFDGQRGWFAAEVNAGVTAKPDPAILEQFNRILHAYVVLGDSRDIPAYAIDDAHKPAAGQLIRSLELFVLGHEYGHTTRTGSGETFGPPPPRPGLRAAWDKEYWADEFGMNLTYGVTGDPSLSFCGIAQFFSCMDAFRRALSILTTGVVGPDSTGSHPPLRLRAQYLRSAARTSMPGAEIERAIGLADQLDSFWVRLWQRSEARWLDMYKRKVAPSDIWS